MTKLEPGKYLERLINVRSLFPSDKQEGTPVVVCICQEGVYLSRPRSKIKLFIPWERIVKHATVPGNAPSKFAASPELLLREPSKGVI